MKNEIKKTQPMSNFRFWLLVWGMGIAGQLCWNMENQWFNTFVYSKIAKDPVIISWMVAISSIATAFSTFFAGTITDRKGKRKGAVAIGYICWGIFTIAFGCTQYITMGSIDPTLLLVAAVAVVVTDAIMSFFGSMGNDSGFNAWTNDMMTENNRGQIGAALATQPVIGTIIGTVVGGMLIGSDENYMRLFVVMGGLVIVIGILSLIFMKDSPELQPHKDGSFWHQFFSVFNFKKFFAMKELLWVNIVLAVFFIAFNMYFTHLGNYMIYYLGFTADMMGYIEAIGLVAAMLLSIPAIKLINKNKAPLVCVISIICNFIGVLVLGITGKPSMVDPTTIFNWNLLIGVFFVGVGYVVILQTLTVWSKQLYPEDSKGQFEGVRITFFVLIPMIVAPMIATPVIKQNGEFINADTGFAEYLPTETLFLVAAGLVLLTFIPLIFATKHHNKRIAAMKAEAVSASEETVAESEETAVVGE